MQNISIKPFKNVFKLSDCKKYLLVLCGYSSGEYDYVSMYVDDFLLVCSKKIYISKAGYAYNSNGLIHRQLLNVKAGDCVDHVDRDRLNNRIENLRMATYQNNAMNKGKYRGSSKYKGVSIRNDKKKFTAQITINRRKFHLGSFSCENEAAAAYNKKAYELFGEFAVLNELPI
jgi:hypothetical protein